MIGAEQIPWLRLWKRELERDVRGAWNAELSRALDALILAIEAEAP